MVQEGLRGIFNLYIEKINSTFKQILDKLSANHKFLNAYLYFTRDFPFFYFCVKFYCLEFCQIFRLNPQYEEAKKQNFSCINNYNLLNISNKTNIINLNDWKNIYVEKYKISISENFKRAFNLLKLYEKNFENKEFLSNENIILHLVNYIKQMSWSYIDLLDEFNLQSEEIILDSDFFLFEMSNIFSESLYENYFEKIILKLEDLILEIKNNSSNIFENSGISNYIGSVDGVGNNTSFSFTVFKFYFYLNSLCKMNEILLSFQVSNIKYLITTKLKGIIEENCVKYTNLIFNEFLRRIIKDLKLILINKDFNSL